MNSHEPFLQATREAPDDDGPRLLYADWLEERGDPRGEFIRVQCGLEREEDERRRWALESRERRLLVEHRREWSQALWDLGCVPIGVAEKGGFRRGLLEEAVMDADVFVGWPEELFRAAPLRFVTLRRAGRRMAQLSVSPWLEQLAGLSLDGEQLTAAEIRALTQSPYLTRLRFLDLSGTGIGGPGAAELGRAKGLSALECLHLRDAAIGRAGAFHLAWSPNLPRLTELDLGHNRVGPEGALELLANRLGGFTELNLDENGVGDEGAAGAANAPAVARLRALHLQGNNITAAGAEALVRSPHLNRLSTLSILENPIGAEAAEALRRRFRGIRLT